MSTSARFSSALRRRIAIFACAAFVFGAALPAGAGGFFGLDEAIGGISQGNRPTTFGNVSIPQLIGRVISVALSLVGVLFLLLTIYGGLLWMTARGDSKTVEKAKDLIKSAVIGLVIVIGAYAATAFIISALAGQQAAPATGTTSPGALGAACAQTNECSGILVCTAGHCANPNYGNCVPGHACVNDADCSANGSCDNAACICDPI